jgi:hypothetical protein
MKKLLGALVFALPLVASGFAQADETGVAGIHSWARVGGKTCLIDHWHDGSGSGSTRGGAEQAAIRAWTDFTAWEYGSSWGRYSLALGRSMKCDRGSGGWSCQTSARACRGW